jgi:hypothetical protein
LIEVGWYQRCSGINHSHNLAAILRYELFLKIMPANQKYLSVKQRQAAVELAPGSKAEQTCKAI